MRAATCVCGTALTLRPKTHPTPLDEWEWADPDGHCTTSTGLLEAVQAAGGWDTLAKTDIGTYSNLQARMALGHAPTFHVHRPARTDPYDGEVPWCHGQPMYRGVHHWTCRTTKQATCQRQ